MPRIRTIRPEVFTADWYSEVSPEAFILYLGLKCYADDKGRLLYRPRELKRRIFPDRPVDIILLFEELRSQGKAELFIIDEKEIINLPDFDNEEVINRPTPSKIPGPGPETSKQSIVEPLGASGVFQEAPGIFPPPGEVPKKGPEKIRPGGNEKTSKSENQAGGKKNFFSKNPQDSTFTESSRSPHLGVEGRKGGKEPITKTPGNSVTKFHIPRWAPGGVCCRISALLTGERKPEPELAGQIFKFSERYSPEVIEYAISEAAKRKPGTKYGRIGLPYLETIADKASQGRGRRMAQDALASEAWTIHLDNLIEYANRAAQDAGAVKIDKKTRENLIREGKNSILKVHGVISEIKKGRDLNQILEATENVRI